MNAITVQQLYDILKFYVKEGKGDKKILLSDDDEGNGYHEMFYSVSPAVKEMFEYCSMPFGVDKEKAEQEYVVLG